MKFKIGYGSSILLGCKFGSKGGLEMGINSTINQQCHIDNRGGIYIGNNVSISPGVSIVTADHDMKSSNFSGRLKSVRIEDYVFIGHRAIILGGVNIAYGSAVGAGALLTKDTVRFMIYKGVPARVYSSRPNDLNYSASYQRIFH